MFSGHISQIINIIPGEKGECDDIFSINTPQLMAGKLIGREKEKKILQRALESDEAEMVSVIGRRRIGKTFLVNEVYKDHIAFSVTGIQNAPRNEQLRNFANQLKAFAPKALIISPPKDWLDAFFLLIEFLKQKDQQKKMVVFLDELPWMATHKSGFLRGLSYFWNSWATRQNIIVVICGSAASWMINKVVKHRGGLHNRITKRIHLQPFTLAETEQYLKSRRIHFDRYQIVQLYMAMGGVPHYLKEIVREESAVQNINSICFSPSGLLRTEFSDLYASLFAQAEKHMAVIRALAQKRQGLTRQELIKATSLSAGGAISRALEELLHSGFIAAYRPFGKKKKEKLYRLTDEYSLFYLQFIEGKEHEDEDIWRHLSQTQAYKTWSGYAFESICLKHIPQIKKAMSIAGIYSLSGSFYKKGTDTEKGAQIDLLIDRNDQVINLFEIKFYNEDYTLTKAAADRLREKMRIFRETTKTRKQLSWVFISAFGLKENSNSLGLITKSLTMDDLFLD